MLYIQEVDLHQVLLKLYFDRSSKCVIRSVHAVVPINIQFGLDERARGQRALG